MPKLFAIELPDEDSEPYEKLADNLKVPVEVLLGRVLARHAEEPAGLHHEIAIQMRALEHRILRAVPEYLARPLRAALAFATHAYAEEVFFTVASDAEDDTLEALLGTDSCAEDVAGEKFDEHWPIAISDEDRKEAIGLAVSMGKTAAILSTMWLYGKLNCPCCHAPLRPIPGSEDRACTCDSEDSE